MYMLYTLIGGGGQMSNTYFESGGKCPPLLIIRGADVLNTLAQVKKSMYFKPDRPHCIKITVDNKQPSLT